MGELIKNIIEKMKLWFNNFFKKKKQMKKKKVQTLINNNDQIKKDKYVLNINLNNDNKSSTIGTFYPKLSSKNKLLLHRKGNTLKKKIIGLELKNNEVNIKIVDNVLKIINEEPIYLNQAIEINNLLNNINNDQELNLNTNEKLNILKDNISIIIDKKLDEYETKILKKAYHEYKEVNYVIVTTLLIDDIIDEINELNEDFNKNKYTKIEYEKKLKKIKDKINKLETINNRKEVQDEIDNLRKDFYTKKKDKYDLLYNEEVFININNKCDELLKQINEKEKDIIHKKRVIIEKKEEKQKEKEELKKKKKDEKDKQKEEFEKEYNENIIKRFIDMEFAHKLILLREKRRKKLVNKEDIIMETIHYYNDFLIGETQKFNFERNKVKTEVTKLYNDITSTICSIEKKEFIPLEHINIKLDVLVGETLERQEILNDIIEKKYDYKMKETENNQKVTNKLTNVLNTEKEKEKKNEKEGKLLKKEYNPYSSKN